MSTLHTVNKSPFDRNSLQSCAHHMIAGDAMIMIEDGVVGARKGSSTSAIVKSALDRGGVFVLAPDLAARGMKAEDVMDGVKLVDYGGFVDLVTQHARTVAWL